MLVHFVELYVMLYMEPFEGIPCSNFFCLHHEQAYVVALSWVKRVHLVSLPATLWMVNVLKYMVVVVH